MVGMWGGLILCMKVSVLPVFQSGYVLNVGDFEYDILIASHEGFRGIFGDVTKDLQSHSSSLFFSSNFSTYFFEANSSSISLSLGPPVASLPREE